MSDPIKNPPPVATLRDGAVSAKVWRNYTREGEPFYSVTIQRTYTDAVTGQARETHSFQGTDILKVQQLAGEAYQAANRLREQDRAQAKEPSRDLGTLLFDREQNGQSFEVAQEHPEVQTPQQGLARQREAAMANAPPGTGGVRRTRQPQR